jgi:ADP-dependent NAD(P)H-hydrate dehydratase / NAD(P)H-hydrate epimerase
LQPVLTAAETQALDRETESRGTPVAELMERAGQAVARAAVALAGGAYGRRAVAVCGKGNNGGDGLVAARYLARWGMGATAVLLGEADGLRDPASTNLRLLERTPGARWVPYGRDRLARELDRADVVLDGVFGTGFRGVAEGDHAEALGLVDGSMAPVVAIDIPSGVEGDTGLVRGPAIRADATVTFGAPKVGDVLEPGASYAGLLEVADIGFPKDLVRGDLLLVEADDVVARLPLRDAAGHKRSSGVVLVVAGSRRMTGAPRLVAEGAYRAGAGLVTVAVPEGILDIVQSGLAEATFLPLPEGPEGSVASGAWGVLAERLPDFDAVAVGPGLSTDGESPALARRLVGEAPVPVVADADAVNAFAGSAGEIADRASDLVLTPHTGEFARLFGMLASDVLEDRVGLVRKAAEETRAVVLLKGPRSLVATPGGQVRVNPTGSSALSTGGTGDVLTGAIAALVARGLPAVDAATVGAYLHGLAGESAGEELGEGATALDVARALSAATSSLRMGGS